jgi:hypothetical protein
MKKILLFIALTSFITSHGMNDFSNKKQTVCATQKRSMSIARISTSYSTEYHINFIQPSKNPMSLIHNKDSKKYSYLCIDTIENLDQQILKLLFENYERIFTLANSTTYKAKKTERSRT